MPRPLPTPDSGVDTDPTEKMHDKFPKEKFGSSVTESAGKMVSPSGKPKRARRHKAMRHAMKRGLVSEKAYEKAMGSAPERARHHGNRDTSQSKESGSRTTPSLGKEHGNR